MSSSPTAPTSTTASSSSSPSPAEPIGRDGRIPADSADYVGSVDSVDHPDSADSVDHPDSTMRPIGVDRTDRVAVVACGAIGIHIGEIARRRGWPVDVHPLPPLLHNHPHRIAGEVAAVLEGWAEGVRAAYGKVVVGYADCGTYGALDRVCARWGIARLPGLHCYDLFAGADRIEGWLAEQPGTFFLTDFLVKSFDRTVWRELGLDRYPQLREDYFRHFTRVIWLAQEPTGELRAEAERVADRLGLPLLVVATGDGAVEAALEVLIDGT